MSDKPARPARAVKLNVLNEPKDSYTGGPSSLCPGCGHDQISSVIINAAWENGIEPHRIAKMSGIGCSSKTPAYYLGQSHGFNTVHGRMPSVTTGAAAVNKAEAKARDRRGKRQRQQRGERQHELEDRLCEGAKAA